MDLPAWKAVASLLCGLVLGLLFIVSGVWKITDPLSWAARIVQLQFPAWSGVPLALGVGTAETFSGVMMMVPRFRRWGAVLAGLMLLAFMLYFAAYYNVLTGEDCSCFPWIQRTVGPGFFIADAVMLLMAWVAAAWSPASFGRKSAALVLAAIAVFTGASYGVAVVRHNEIRAPASILVDGQPVSLESGRWYLYFFDPECTHCLRSAQEMQSYQWKGARVVVVPTRLPQFTAQFLRDSGLKAAVSSDAELLRKIFSFTDPPYAVAIEDGRQRVAISAFEGDTQRQALVKAGFIK